MADDNDEWDALNEMSVGSTQLHSRRNYCVVRDGFQCLDPHLTFLLKRAKKLLTEYKASSGYTTVEKVLKVKKRIPELVYVIPEFSGQLYEHLIHLNARIYSPLAIIQSLEKHGKIAEYPKPLLALSCEGSTITATGMELEDRAELFEKAEALGAVVTGILDPKRTTHLFATESDPHSAKYACATEHKIPILHSDFIKVLHQLAMRGVEKFLEDDHLMKKYRVRIFTGCVVTTSGFNAEIRKKATKIVEEYGGRFTGNMDSKISTHLITDSRNGEKYRSAMSWGTVNVVSMKWLTQSVRNNIRLPESAYFPGEPNSIEHTEARTVPKLNAKKAEPVDYPDLDSDVPSSSGYYPTADELNVNEADVILNALSLPSPKHLNFIPIAPPSSEKSASSHNEDNLNLSYPIAEYIEGNRPVKLHLPFTQMLAQFDDTNEDLDSPTIDPIMLKKAITRMAKNSCVSDSAYHQAMGHDSTDNQTGESSSPELPTHELQFFVEARPENGAVQEIHECPTQGSPRNSLSAHHLEPSGSSQILKRKSEEMEKSQVLAEPPSKKQNSESPPHQVAPEKGSSLFCNVTFTNFDKADYSKLRSLVHSIQGTVQKAEAKTEDILVCDKLQISLKLLMALAAGKFVVPSKYVSESSQQKRWLDIEEYEYGNPKSVKTCVITDDAKLAEQIKIRSYQMRMNAISTGHGAFHGRNVLLFCASKTAEFLTLIIKAGGGESKTYEKVSYDEYKDFSMAIISTKDYEVFSEAEKDALNNYNVPYYADKVVADYLFSDDTEAALKRHEHMWYKTHLKSGRRESNE